jgi:hypothetical protein
MTAIAKAETFVGLRRIFFIEVILFPAAISSLVTVAHALERKREGSAGYQRKADPPSPLFECSPRKLGTNIQLGAARRIIPDYARAFLQQSIIPGALTRQYAEEALPWRRSIFGQNLLSFLRAPATPAHNDLRK